MLAEELSIKGASGVRRSRRFSPSCRHRLSGSRPAARRIIGAGRCGRWAMMCADPSGLCEAVRQAQQERRAKRGRSAPPFRFRTCILSLSRARATGLARARAGAGFVRQATHATDELRSQPICRLGVVAAQGWRGFAELRALIDAGDARISQLLAAALRELVEQAEGLKKKIAALEEQILAIAKENETMRRLATVRGVGGLTARAIVAAVGDGRQFGLARDFAAWCGLTRRENSSAGKRRESGVSRMGDIKLRKLFARRQHLMRNARSRSDRATQWQCSILASRRIKVAVLAQAAKTARIAWAILTSGETHKPRLAASRSLGSAL
jgi:transposase